MAHSSVSQFVLALLHPLLHRPYPTLQWDEHARVSFSDQRTGSACAASSNPTVSPSQVLHYTPLVLSVSHWQSVAFVTWKPKVIDLYFHSYSGSFPTLRFISIVTCIHPCWLYFCFPFFFLREVEYGSHPLAPTHYPGDNHANLSRLKANLSHALNTTRSRMNQGALKAPSRRY